VLTDFDLHTTHFDMTPGDLRAGLGWSSSRADSTLPALSETTPGEDLGQPQPKRRRTNLGVPIPVPDSGKGNECQTLESIELVESSNRQTTGVDNSGHGDVDFRIVSACP
jgi:hypothetical protein